MTKKHYVTLEIELEGASHPEVQSRVLAAVVKVFEEDRAGSVSVTGYDKKKHENELKRMTEERDAFKAAWSALRDQEDERDRRDRARTAKKAP